ncbi:hypothetical protein CJ178_01450 [Rhodococcus sp. ACPA4]|jgi:hypothetical protein|uniref:DUF5302 domain-containing protein n=2 Tax=Nocardiaceae TaxID=85025 RepID=A0A652YIL1_NOCGL|nr:MULTISPECIES: DUF5302 domain-containing protein [Rhodococcus]NMD63952.1 DUF5302 domain-containing protein [Nocardia globerula]KJF22045.1 hypothetical protein SZ00_02693 [Rhodococcus sp. AD45]MCE4265305.1 DUF5302 domain-containing protein [Rhodococcus globerulus]MDV6269204.1 DUF5302 domain-containing protein [Rhodococcus globerulus]MDV8067691.1 DUF5302 domain-containing protein [Rhodococcus sp. IEGM 1366]
MSEQDSTNPESETTSESETPAEANKRKFREALERKNHSNATAADHRDGQSKVHSTHGSADHKREFRRKSG